VADIKTLFKSIFKGKSAPSAPVATPPVGPAVPTIGTGRKGHPLIPDKIPDHYKDAIDIITGKKQKDEMDSILKSKWGFGIGAAALLANNITKLPLSSSAMQYLSINLMAGQVLSGAITSIKPWMRAKLTLRSKKTLDNLKKIETMEYDINVYDIVASSGNVTMSTVPSGTVKMTLKKIAESIQNGKLYGNDAWRSGDEFFTFANQKDVDNINQMFKTNMSANDRDVLMSEAMPFIAGGATLVVQLAYIHGAQSAIEKRAKDKTTGKPIVFTPQTPEQKSKSMQSYRDKYKFNPKTGKYE
jgi:hypothetical protein